MGFPLSESLISLYLMEILYESCMGERAIIRSFPQAANCSDAQLDAFCSGPPPPPPPLPPSQLEGLRAFKVMGEGLSLPSAFACAWHSSQVCLFD